MGLVSGGHRAACCYPLNFVVQCMARERVCASGQAVQMRFSAEQAARRAAAEERRAGRGRRRRRRWHPQSFLLLRLVGEQHRRGQPELLDQVCCLSRKRRVDRRDQACSWSIWTRGNVMWPELLDQVLAFVESTSLVAMMLVACSRCFGQFYVRIHLAGGPPAAIGHVGRFVSGVCLALTRDCTC